MQNRIYQRDLGAGEADAEPIHVFASIWEFARQKLGCVAHKALVKRELGKEIVMHLSRDSTMIEAREKAGPKETPPPRA